MFDEFLILPKTQLNQSTFHNLESHLPCWHIKTCTLTRHTIYDSLVNIQQFRHEWLISNIRKYPKRRNKINEQSITLSHTWHIDIAKHVYWLDTYFVKVWWRCVLLPNANAVYFCDIFSDIGQCFGFAQAKSPEHRNFDNIRMIISSLYMIWCRLACQITDNRQNSKRIQRLWAGA